MSWTPERVEEALKLNEAGFSASLIASRLGGVSRNAVIGKLHRLGRRLNSAETEKHSRYKNQPRFKKPSVPRVSRITGQPVIQQAPAAVFLPLPLPRAEDKARIAFTDLEPHHCRFPVGEPTEGFCGLQKMEGSSYCEGHHVRCCGGEPVSRNTSGLKPRWPTLLASKVLPSEREEVLESV